MAFEAVKINDTMASSDRRYMVDEALLGEIVVWAGLSGADAVLEVGGGTGNLTERLAAVAKLSVVEYEHNLCVLLRKRFREVGSVSVIEGDAVRVPYPKYNKIVSNIPYSVSRQLIERFVAEGFEVAVLVVQREFADKLMAKPDTDNYRMVSVLAQSTCDVELLREIPREAFEPVPRVKSAAVRMRQRWRPDKGYIRFLNTLFSQKNKKLRNIIDVPQDYQQMRPDEMAPADFARLYRVLGGGGAGSGSPGG
jgi:16S rRNA (adenine1518-N6/adenine1519-N6)-dimethyltransferase